MPKNLNDDSLESTRPLSEQEERAIARCLNMIDYISDTAANMVINFLQSNPCPEAKRFLLNRPEDLAIKTFEKTINDIIHGGRQPGEQAH